MSILCVEGLNKTYPGFALTDVSFTLDEGYIMGFIGRNGAGKTTTLKSIMRLVHPDSGRITVLGQDFSSHEIALKQRIGYMVGDRGFYPTTRVRRVTDTYRRFYHNWNQRTYETLLNRFDVDDSKTLEHLSAGMKVKYSLALALSHSAELLILDEPTSGLDPVSRDDLLDLFRELIEEGNRSILFSTHITSDLEKCADYITYIANGRVIASEDKDEFLGSYAMARGSVSQLTDDLRGRAIGIKEHKLGFTALLPSAATPQALAAGIQIDPATIEDIMVYHERTPHTEGDLS